MTDPNQYNPQNPQQAQQYGGYGSYGQNDYGQQAPQYGAPDYGQQAPQYGAPQYRAPQYGNAAGYNQQQPQYGAPQPQPQGSGSFFALTAPLDQPAYNCTIGEAFIRFWKSTPRSRAAPPAANSGGGFCAHSSSRSRLPSSSRCWAPSSAAIQPMECKASSTPFGHWQRLFHPLHFPFAACTTPTRPAPRWSSSTRLTSSVAFC